MTNISESLEEKAAREIMALITAPCAIYDYKVRDKHYFDRIGAIVQTALTTKDQEIERLKAEIKTLRLDNATDFMMDLAVELTEDGLKELEGSPCSS